MKSILLRLLLEIGLPLAIKSLKKLLGLTEAEETLLREYAEEKKAAKKKAKERLRECRGLACPPDTKGLG